MDRTNKKKKIIITLLVVVLIGALISSLIFFNKKKQKNVSVSSKISVSEFQESLDKLLKKDIDYSQMPQYLSSLEQACSCEVVSVSPIEDSNSYTAIINVTYADVADDLVSYLESLGDAQFDEDKLNSDIAELVSNAESATSECEIYFMVEDDIYTPIFTEEIIDKMYGGIYSAYYNKLNEIAEKMKGSEQN